MALACGGPPHSIIYGCRRGAVGVPPRLGVVPPLGVSSSPRVCGRCPCRSHPFSGACAGAPPCSPVRFGRPLGSALASRALVGASSARAAPRGPSGAPRVLSPSGPTYAAPLFSRPFCSAPPRVLLLLRRRPRLDRPSPGRFASLPLRAGGRFAFLAAVARFARGARFARAPVARFARPPFGKLKIRYHICNGKETGMPGYTRTVNPPCIHRISSNKSIFLPWL